MKLLLSFVFLISLCIPTSRGRGTWNASGQYEYYVSLGGNSTPYDEAQAYCNGQGGQLALVKTQNVQQFIQKLVANNSGQPYGFYIGLRYNESKRTFVWNDGESLSYTNWERGEPNNIKNDTCVIMGWIYTYTNNLTWYDIDCFTGSSGPKGYVCQRLADNMNLTMSFKTTTGFTTSKSIITNSTATAGSLGTKDLRLSSATIMENVSTGKPNISSTIDSTTTIAQYNTLFVIVIGTSVGIVVMMIVAAIVTVYICKRRKFKNLNGKEAKFEREDEDYGQVNETNGTICGNGPESGAKNQGKDEETPYEDIRVANNGPPKLERENSLFMMQPSTSEEPYVTMSASPTSPIARKSFIPTPNPLKPVSENDNPGDEQPYVTMLGPPTTTPIRAEPRKSLPLINAARNSNPYGTPTVEEAPYVSMSIPTTTRRAKSLVPGASNNPNLLQLVNEPSYVAMDTVLTKPKGRRSLVPQANGTYFPSRFAIGTEATYVNAADIRAQQIAMKSLVSQNSSQYSSHNNRTPKAEETYMSMTGSQAHTQTTSARQVTTDLSNSVYVEMHEAQ